MSRLRHSFVSRIAESHALEQHTSGRAWHPRLRQRYSGSAQSARVANTTSMNWLLDAHDHAALAEKAAVNTQQLKYLLQTYSSLLYWVIPTLRLIFKQSIP